MKITRIIVVLLATALLAGCKTVQTAIVPQTHETYTEHNTDNLRQERDSILVHDSIYIREKGDTVYIYKEHIRDRWCTRTDSIIVTDSVIVRDSVPFAVEVIKPVNIRSGYDKFCSWFFWIVVVLLIIFIVYRVLMFRLDKLAE